MNQATFANMGGARPTQQVNQQVGGMQRNGSTSTDIQSQILNIIRTQPIPQGWQQTVSPKQRAAIIHQMVTGLRIVKSDMTLQYAISVATGFEVQQFNIAPDQETYTHAYRQKLQEIQATRQNQANVQQLQFQNQQAAQMGLTPQQMQARNMMNNQNHFQQGFGVQQPQQPGQPLAVPMQQQPSQNQRQNNPAEMQQPMQNGHSAQNGPRPGPPNRGPQFTPEESQQINNIFRGMLARLTDQERANISSKLARQVSQQQHQIMQAQGIDPVNAYIRSQATHTFMNDKQRRLQLAGQGLATPANTGVAPQARPTAQTPIRGQQQALPPQTPQHPDSAFGVGNLDQFVGQQQEGLRHQAAGQDVVPASNGQAPPQQIRGTPHQQPPGQFGPNGRLPPPNPFQPQAQPQAPWNNAQNQQANVTHTPQMPMQPSTPNMVNSQGQTPHQQQLQGQVGGLTNNRGQRTPQQNPKMPTLNQPMDPPNQNKSEVSQRPSQSVQQSAQRSGLNGHSAAASSAQQNVGQQIQALPALQGDWISKFPPHLRQQLQSMPEQVAKRYILEMRKKQQQQQHQQRMKQAADAQNLGQQQQNPTQPGAQVVLPGGKVNQPGISQAPSTVNTTSSAPGSTPIGRVNGQPQGSQPGQPEISRPALQRALPPPLNEAQVNYMDTQNFPPPILNKNSSLGQLPDNVKTWRQLKEYVHRNAQNLPQGSMQNVLGLQSFHMQQMVAAQKRMQQQAQANPLGNPPHGQTGQAPQAPPMVAPQVNQAPLQGAGPPGQFSMPVLPQPTPQEVHAARATLPAQMKAIPDAQLRQMILSRRQQEYLKSNQQKMTPQQQQIMQRNNMLQAQLINAQQNRGQVGQNQAVQMQQPVRNQGQPPQPSQQQKQPQQSPKQPTAPQAKQAQNNRQNNAPQTGQKATKRSTNDDVVEVPDPKTQQQPRPPIARTAQHPMTGMQQMNHEAFARLSNEQKIQVQARMQEAQRARSAATGQNVPVQPSVAPSNQATGRHAPGPVTDPAYETLKREVEAETPVRAIVPMSPRTRNQMVEKLKDETALMVQRIDQSLPIFLKISKTKSPAKELLRMRLILLRQVHDPGFTVPVDNFTMTVQELQDYKNKLHVYFTYMMKNFTPPPAASTTQGQTQAQTQPSQPQQLNAANLQQQQAGINAARVASAQKSQAENSNRPPAAPTTAHAPFAFGSQSPQGVPHMYAAKNELTQEQLKLPQAKKRKPNQGASASPTPATMNTPVGKSSPAAKVESPGVQRHTAVPNLMKCPVPDCESGKMGFATKEDLEKHRTDAHEPKEPAIKDPLDAAAYAIESLKIALNLDENGKSRGTTQPKEDKALLQPPAMKTTASSQGQNIKQEVATPMSRNPTQTGPSPSSNLLRTPQAAAAAKTPSSDFKTELKDAVTKVSSAKLATAAMDDPWATSHVKPEWFKEVFSEVANLNRSVPDDFITDWLDRNPFTPPSSPSSGDLAKESPQKSDISANDHLDINVITNGDEWLQFEWFDQVLPGDMEALDMGDLMDTEWETGIGNGGEDDEVLGKGKRRRDPMDPSDEWMKVYAPDKYEENKRRESQKKR